MNMMKFGNTSPYFFRSNRLIFPSMFPSNHTNAYSFYFLTYFVRTTAELYILMLNNYLPIKIILRNLLWKSHGPIDPCNVKEKKHRQHFLKSGNYFSSQKNTKVLSFNGNFVTCHSIDSCQNSRLYNYLYFDFQQM